jgi:hypothetical protein
MSISRHFPSFPSGPISTSHQPDYLKARGIMTVVCIRCNSYFSWNLTEKIMLCFHRVALVKEWTHVISIDKSVGECLTILVVAEFMCLWWYRKEVWLWSMGGTTLRKENRRRKKWICPSTGPNLLRGRFLSYWTILGFPCQCPSTFALYTYVINLLSTLYKPSSWETS